MVVPRDAPSADEAVELGRFYVVSALRTKRQFDFKQVLGRLFGVFAGEQEVDDHDQQIEEGCECVEADVGVLSEDIHLNE